MRSVQRGLSVGVLVMLLLSLGVPLLAAQEASPVVIDDPVSTPPEQTAPTPTEQSVNAAAAPTVPLINKYVSSVDSDSDRIPVPPGYSDFWDIYVSGDAADGSVVTLTDALPSGLAYGSPACSGIFATVTSCSIDSGNVLTATFTVDHFDFEGLVDSDVTDRYSFTVEIGFTVPPSAVAGTEIANTACVVASTRDGSLTSGQACDTNTIVISPSITPTESATATEMLPTSTGTATQTPTEPATSTATIAPTETPSATTEPSATPSNTATATEIPTETLLPTNTPTATDQPTSTATLEPTRTSTPVATATRTVDPCATLVPSSVNAAVVVCGTETPTATTTASPTATTTATEEPSPTATATSTPTETAVPPTATSTSTSTLEPTATDIATNTVEPTATSTREATSTSTVESTATATTQNTETVEPTSTATATTAPTATTESTATSTSPPSATPVTPTTTPTNAPTATEVLPTATSTATTTSTATAEVPPTATATASATEIPPTATKTVTPENTPTETSTATTVPPTATSTTSPSPTATGTAVNPESGAVIVRVETTDGSDLPDGLQACVDADCRPLGTLASTQVMALAPPSGSGVAFFDVALGLHEVTLRDGSGAVIDVRDVVVLPDDATEVTFILDRRVPTATTVPLTMTPATLTPAAVSDLPNTGQGGGSGSSLPLLLLGLASLTLMGAMGLRARHQRR
jgi:hypothetical protein